MFFILSKVLFFLLKPLNWVLFLMVIGLWSKQPKRKNRFFAASLGLSLLLCNHFIFNQVVQWWEPETLQFNEIQDTFDIAILLGGYSNFDTRPNKDRHNFNERGNRFFNALELFAGGHARKLLLTGGSGELLNQEDAEANMIPPFLHKLGIPPEVIIVENQSRNTYENGLYTQKIIDEQFPNARCLLITSAWHMPRSLAIFEKLNLDVTPIAVDYLSERTRFHPESLLQPDRLGFYHWELLIKEWVGYWAYWAKGYL